MGSRGWGHQLRKNRALIRRALWRHHYEQAMVAMMHRQWDAMAKRRPFWQSLKEREGKR